MHVDVARSARLTQRIARQELRGRGDLVARLVARRRTVDERFDPAKALAGTARYLAFARAQLGRTDLALAAYHMGVGNLQSVIRLSGEDAPSYARLYFDATPARNPAVQKRLASFGDDSSTYLFKIYAAADIMRLFRRDPSKLARLDGLHANKNSAEEVLHPPGDTPSFPTPAALKEAWDDGDIVLFPQRPAVTGLARDPTMGALAERLGVPRGLYRGLRPEALAMALYIGAQVRAYAGGDAPLVVTSTVRDETLPAAAGGQQPRGDAELLPAHDGLGVRHRAVLHVGAPGARLPVRARPAAGAGRDRVGAGARRDPHHRVARRGGARAAAVAARPVSRRQAAACARASGSAAASAMTASAAGALAAARAS